MQIQHLTRARSAREFPSRRSFIPAVLILAVLMLAATPAAQADQRRHKRSHRSDRSSHVQRSNCSPRPHFVTFGHVHGKPKFNHTSKKRDSKHYDRHQRGRFDDRGRHDRLTTSPYWAGYRLGQRIGYDDGYRDGRFGRKYCCDVPPIQRRCSNAERRGFIAGYQAAYRDGYNRGRAIRSYDGRTRVKFRCH